MSTRLHAEAVLSPLLPLPTWDEILTQRHQTSVSFELRTGLASLAWQPATVEGKWDRPVIFSVFSCYVSLWVLFTRGQPFTWFRCTSVTFPVGQSWAAAGMGFLSTLATFGRYYYSDIELIFYRSLGKFVHFVFYTHSCLPYVLTFSHTTVCPYKAFSTKHYLFKERFKHKGCCATYSHICFVLMCCNFNIHCARHLQPLWSSLLIHVTLTAERGRLDIPHHLTHSCLVKSLSFSRLSLAKCKCFLRHLGLWVFANRTLVLMLLLHLTFSWRWKGLNVLLEFPKQIITVWFWGDLQPLAVTRFILLVRPTVNMWDEGSL